MTGDFTNTVYKSSGRRVCKFSEDLLCALSISTFPFDTKPKNILNIFFLVCFHMSLWNVIIAPSWLECMHMYVCVSRLYLSEFKHTKGVRSYLLISFVCLRIPYMFVCVLACSGHYCSTPLQIISSALRDIFKNLRL